MDGTLSLKRHLPEDFECSAHWTPYFQTDFEYSTTGTALGPSSLLLQKSPFYPVQIGQEGAFAQASYHLADWPTQRPKRRRLDHEPAMVTMPSCIGCQVGAEPEKSIDTLPLLENSPQSALSRGGSIIGAAAEGVVDFFSSLATCQTSSVQEDHSAFTALEQETSTPFSTQTATSNTVSLPGMYAEGLYTDSSNSTVTENWLSDDITESSIAPMQSFPALQPIPSQPVFFPVNAGLQSLQQPSTHLESMTYPSGHQISKNAAGAFQLISTAAEGSAFPTNLQATFDITNFLDSAGQPLFSASVAPSLATDKFSAPLDDSTSLMPTRGSIASSHTAVSPTLYHFSPTQTDAFHQQSQQHLLNHVTTVSYVDAVETHSTQHSRPPVSRRGPFRDHAERLRTAETRKIGSCVRCRMQRVRCNSDPNDPSGECLGCKKPLSRVWRLPCMRLKISDIVLGKTSQVKGYEWTLRWKENTIVDSIGNWASSDIRVVRVTEGYTGNHVELKVRQFIPQEGDSLVRSWVTPTGETRSVKIPPYAIVEPQTIRALYTDYIKTSLHQCCNAVVKISDKTGLIESTYNMAFELLSHDQSLSDQERHLLATALELFMSVRLTTKSFEIVGDETLGMSRSLLDDSSGLSGKIPVPPVMGAQIDSVIIHEIQAKLRREVLDALHKLITENKSRSWFTSYLVIFILLHNAALIIDHDASYAIKHGMKRRFAREEKVKQYYTGATTLLVYFHYCNKGVFPFTDEAREQDIRNVAYVDDKALQFLRTTKEYVAENRSEWQAMREKRDYGNPCFFLSQLFEANWQPQDMVIT